MKVKVYLHEVYHTRNKMDTTIILASKEFGWIEYYDDGELFFNWKNKKDMIEGSYVPRGKEFESFEKYGKLTLLGYL